VSMRDIGFLWRKRGLHLAMEEENMMTSGRGRSEQFCFGTEKQNESAIFLTMTGLRTIA
jgi:hypothetical protein